MQIPAYWAHALVDEQGNETEKRYGFSGVGWSDLSQEDAYQQALDRARRVARTISTGGDRRNLRENYYADRPLREPIIDELIVDGERIGVITQNIYGAYVLNAANAMFVDIDVPPPPRPPGLIAKIFGAKTPPPPREPIEEIRNNINRLGIGMKVYRTPNGFRGLVTHRPYDPGKPDSERLLEGLKSDALYIRLCKAQQCFRARLTPKPYRIGMNNPPRAYPFADERKLHRFEQWQSEYDKVITGYAACEPLDDSPWGKPEVHADIAPVLAMHDELACSPGKPLA